MSHKTMEGVRDLERDLDEMREYYRHGNTREASWRRSQLKGLLTLLEEKEGDIFKALMHDLGKHHVEAFRDEVHEMKCLLEIHKFPTFQGFISYIFRI